jgi:hypothetical protein
MINKQYIYICTIIHIHKTVTSQAHVSGNASKSYLGGTLVESWPGQRLS